jgi:hypothetical protein
MFLYWILRFMWFMIWWVCPEWFLLYHNKIGI